MRHQLLLMFIGKIINHFWQKQPSIKGSFIKGAYCIDIIILPSQEAYC